MNKMNFNSKKETADKKERQGADDATKLQDEQVNAAEENATSDNVTDEGPEQKELEELKKKYPPGSPPAPGAGGYSPPG